MLLSEHTINILGVKVQSHKMYTYTNIELIRIELPTKTCLEPQS
jgi:hypothetical protein